MFLTVIDYMFPAFICSNSAILIKCEICSKLTIEAPDIVQVSLLLALNIFDTSV